MKRAKPLRVVRAATGALLHPLVAYLIHRSLPTLALRVERAQANAQGIARRLVVHPDIATISHPELGSTRNAHLLGTQMSVPGTLIAFEMVGGYQAAAAIMAQVRMITPAVSLGSVDTLIQHPSGLTHRVVADEAKSATGITPGCFACRLASRRAMTSGSISIRRFVAQE